MESISARARIGCRVNPAEFLLAGVIVARSTSLLLSKALLTTMSPLNILSVRFCLAFVILCAIFFNRMKRMDLRTLLMGMAIGGAFSAMMAAELFALKHTLASTTSFLENTAIVIVPLMEALLHKRLPCKRALLCAGLTLIGVGALTLRSGRFSFGLGEGLCILSAMLYALAIILTDRLSKKGDPMLIGIAQVGFIGLFTTIASFIFEAPKLPSCASEWLPILGLALVCSCFGFTLQPVAQRRIPSERASQFCALNPLSTAAMSAVLLHEKMGVMGAALATVLSQVASAVLTLRCIVGSQGMPWHIRAEKLRLHGDVFAAICTIGVPAAAQSAMYNLSNMVIQSCMNSFGTDTIAAWTAYGKVDSIFWMIMGAYGVAITTFAGQNFGAGKYDRIHKSVKVCLGMAAFTSVLLSAVVLLGGRIFFRLFTSDDSVIDIGLHMMAVISPSYITYICIEILGGTARGCGDSIIPMLLTCFGICVLRVIWILVIVPLRPDVSTVAFSYPLTWTVTSVMFIIYYLRGNWLKRRRGLQ